MKRRVLPSQTFPSCNRSLKISLHYAEKLPATNYQKGNCASWISAELRNIFWMLDLQVHIWFRADCATRAGIVIAAWRGGNEGGNMGENRRGNKGVRGDRER